VAINDGADEHAEDVKVGQLIVGLRELRAEEYADRESRIRPPSLRLSSA
jgi:hypothetical protein